MVKVKVCGLTRVDDAALACKLGASAIGMVFWEKSPRVVDTQRATQIVQALPADVTSVGVFVNADLAWVCDVVAEVGLGAVQLHGEESPAYCQAMPVEVLKAVSIKSADDVQRALTLPEEVTPLVDVHDPERRGGTGVTVDWTTAARLARERRVFLAGGLSAANIADAIDIVRPYGIDVSSSLESSPGTKDPVRMRSFFAAVGTAGGGEPSAEPLGDRT